MRTNNKGWDSCGHAPARVDGAWQIILACDVTEAPHDKHQAEPVAQATLAPLTQAGLERPKDASGTAQALPATLDNGSDSEAAVVALETRGCDPSMATGRQGHPGAQSLFEKYQAASRLSINRVIATYTNVSLVPGNSS
jgi:hypothetical protein